MINQYIQNMDLLMKCQIVSYFEVVCQTGKYCQLKQNLKQIGYQNNKILDFQRIILHQYFFLLDLL